MEIHREAGFHFRIWANDHPPPHVHVWKAGGYMKVILADPVSIAAVGGLSLADARRACRIVESNIERFVAEWKKIHD